MLVRERAVSYMIERKAEFSCFFPGGRPLTATSPRWRAAASGATSSPCGPSATCDGVAIHVITSTSENWYLKYTPDEQQSAKQIFLGYVAPAHYNAFGLPPEEKKKKRKVEAIAPKAKAIAKKPRMTKREKIKAGKMRCPSRSCGVHARCSYCGRTRAKIAKSAERKGQALIYDRPLPRAFNASPTQRFGDVLLHAPTNSVPTIEDARIPAIWRRAAPRTNKFRRV